MFNGSNAPVAMKWCFNHSVTTLLVFLITRTKILHPTLHISQKKNLQLTRTAVIYSMIRRRKKKINLWSVQCNKHCPFVHHTVELPCTKVRNYSHIFLFVPASIVQQLFPPPGFPLQACNFFWNEYRLCSKPCRETLLCLPCKGSVNGNLPTPGNMIIPSMSWVWELHLQNKRKKNRPWLCFPNLHFIVSGKGKGKEAGS